MPLEGSTLLATVLAIVCLAAAASATSGSNAPTPVAAGGPDRGWAPAGVTATNYRLRLSGGWTTWAQLTTPVGDGPFPVVVLVHGSGLNDLDETLGTDAAGRPIRFFRPIAKRLTQAGFAVVRYDKRGVVASGPRESAVRRFRNPPDSDTRYTIDAADVATLVAQLPQVDASRVFLLGHSEGTLDVSNVAAGRIRASDGSRPRIAGVVAMGVVGLPMKRIMYYQLIERNLDVLREVDRNRDGMVSVAEVERLAPAIRGQLVANGRFDPALDRNGDNRLSIANEVAPALRAATGFDRYPNLPDPTGRLRPLLRSMERNGTVTGRLPGFRGPVLLMNGRNDSQTTVDNAVVANRALARAGHPDHTLLLYDGLGHTFNRTALDDGAFGEPAPRVVADLVAWVSKRAGVPPR